MDNSSRTEYTVATIGFDVAEKEVLQGMFGISAGRTPSFVPYRFSRARGPDLVLLDYDNPSALNGWHAYRRVHADAGTMPVVAVSRVAVEAASYVLKRPVIATWLLGTLEKVATQELGFQHAHAFDDEGTFVLEMSDATATADAPTSVGHGSTVPDAAPVEPAAGVRALVVDDSMPVRIQMKIVLGGIADHVDYAETGEEAQALLERNRYNIVFLDVILPGIDGYQVCKGIKRNPDSAKTPVIMLTSSSSPVDRVKGRLAGCDTYLIKPVRKSVFEEVVRDYLDPVPPRDSRATGDLTNGR